MIQVFTAPENYIKPLKVFLGGTIDSGKIKLEIFI